MRGKHAADIRQGILQARAMRGHRGLIILNSRYYSALALRAFSEYRRRHESVDLGAVP